MHVLDTAVHAHTAVVHETFNLPFGWREARFLLRFFELKNEEIYNSTLHTNIIYSSTLISVEERLWEGGQQTVSEYTSSIL